MHVFPQLNIFKREAGQTRKISLAGIRATTVE